MTRDRVCVPVPASTPLEREQASDTFDSGVGVAVGTGEGEEGLKLPDTVRIEANRLRFEGKEEVTIECGEASITLRKDGKVIIRGSYVETYATGMNRIKGAAIKLN